MVTVILATIIAILGVIYQNYSLHVINFIEKVDTLGKFGNNKDQLRESAKDITYKNNKGACYILVGYGMALISKDKEIISYVGVFTSIMLAISIAGTIIGLIKIKGVKKIASLFFKE